jgi:hypothetical protein
MMVLEAVTPEKIANAELRDLMLAFKVLSDRENLEIGKPTEIKGLVSYLVQIEKESVAMKTVGETISTSVVGSGEDLAIVSSEDLEDIPNL